MRLARTYLASLILLISTPSFGGEIIVSTLPYDPFNGSGYFIGTVTFSTGDVTYSVAERFTTYRDYSAITGEALLGDYGGLIGQGVPGPTVSLSILSDMGGVPGGVLAATSVAIPPAPNSFVSSYASYGFGFQDLVLQDATSYWLLASSVGEGIAAWPQSPTFYEGSQTALYRNGEWASFLGYTTVFSLSGSVLGDPIDNGLGQIPAIRPPASVPEPSSIVLLASGLALICKIPKKRLLVS